MKNLNLSTKLALLSLILSGFLLLTGWVGWSRLSVLSTNTDELGNKVFGRVLRTAEIRAKLFIMVRSQKNAVLSNDDASSRDFATESEAAAKELIELANRFESESLDTALRANASLLKAEIHSLVTNNTECLKYAKINSTLKAKVLLANKIIPTMERFSQSAQRIIESSSANTSAAPDKGAAKAFEIVKSTQELIHSLFLHIATPSSEASFGTIDKSARAKLEGFKTWINAFKDESKSIESELKNSLAVLHPDVEEFLTWSTLDSNGKSTELSLVKTKEALDSTLQILDEVTSAATSEADKAVKKSSKIYSDGGYAILGTSIVGLALGFLASYFVSHSITKPVALVKNLAQEMASGNLMTRINLKQRDEVGELAIATDSLADALSNVVGQIQKASENLSGSSDGLGNIAKSLVNQSEQTSAQATGVSAASEQLSANITTMSSAAEEMSMNFASISSATEEMSASVDSISSAAEQTSSNVAAVTTAIHDISVSFEHVLGNVRDGAKVANNASQMADSATSTMKQLDRSSVEISKVTETIKMIALQTNLLALNATIEATSAGEAGKGFAVVANEIKQLANQSAKAAEDIATKIEGVQVGTRHAVGVIQEIAAVIKEINGSADRISTSVEQQSRAAQTISQNIAQANTGVGQIARSISEVAVTANDMSRSIAEATRGATDVSRNVGEAAKAATEISDSIGQVSKAAQETNRSSESVTTASETLAQLSRELNKLASRFKLPSNGS